MTYSRYRRPIPALPAADSLPFPGNLIRQCSDCDLRKGCTAPVPGDGVTPAYVMFVGEAPGKDEDEWGYKPFVGKAGQQLNYLLMQCGLNRENIYISNTVHCRPFNNREPKADEIKACAKWLNIELGLVQPQIIVAMGAPAIRWFLGNDAGTVEHLHGRPIEKDGQIILPCYHPAAGLYDTAILRFIGDDFRVLRGLLNGKTVADYTIKDEYPNPDYRVVDTKQKIDEMMVAIHFNEQVAIDVETVKWDTELWSLQASVRPGTGFFLPIAAGYKGRIDVKSWNKPIIVHNYLHDINQLDIPDNDFFYSMVMAYLLGFSQGL